VVKSHSLDKEQWTPRCAHSPSKEKTSGQLGKGFLPVYTDAHTLLKAGVQMTSYVEQLLPSPPDQPLHSPSVSPVVGSSVINVLRCSCRNILTVTDFIIDGSLLGFAE